MIKKNKINNKRAQVSTLPQTDGNIRFIKIPYDSQLVRVIGPILKLVDFRLAYSANNIIGKLLRSTKHKVDPVMSA